MKAGNTCQQRCSTTNIKYQNMFAFLKLSVKIQSTKICINWYIYSNFEYSLPAGIICFVNAILQISVKLVEQSLLITGIGRHLSCHRQQVVTKLLMLLWLTRTQRNNHLYINLWAANHKTCDIFVINSFNIVRLKSPLQTLEQVAWTNLGFFSSLL